MKKFIVASVVAITVAATSVWAQTVTIAQWTFETAGDTNGMTLAPGAGGNPGSIAADNGLNSGVSSPATGLHTGAATYSTPGGDLDPTIAVMAPTDGSGPGLANSSLADASPSVHAFSATAWAVGDYWQFSTSTLGFTGVSVAWDQAGSNTGPGNFSLYYSANGGAFTLAGGPFTIPLSTWNTTTVGALSTNVPGGGAFDNATMIFRVVDNSTVSVAGGTTASGGTDRIDNFTVVGVPEPSTVLLVCAGLAGGLLAMRRRRS